MNPRKSGVAYTLTSLLLGLLVFTPALALGFDFPSARFDPLHQPQCLRINDGHLLSQYQQSSANTVMNVRHMGEPGSVELEEQVANPVRWDPSPFTGLQIPWHRRASEQRGFRDDARKGSSVFQLSCEATGFLINTFQFEHASGEIECPDAFPDCRGGPNVTRSRRFQPSKPIFTRPDSLFTLQTLMALPYVHWGQNPAVGQVALYAYFEEPESEIIFAWLIQLYDSRSWGDFNGDTLAAYDGVTAFASAPLSPVLANGETNPFVTISPYSARMHNRYGYQGERFYRAHLAAGQFSSILEALQIDASHDPQDWRLLEVGVLTEIGWNGDPGSNIVLGGSIRGLGAYEAYTD